MEALRRTIVALGAATLLLLSGCAISAPTPTAQTLPASLAAANYEFGTAAIEWSPCPEPPLANLQCATYTVPLDYAAPNGDTLSLALRRLPATAPDPIGTLFFNPGGPGGTGSGQFPEWADLFPDAVQQRFDLVSWDPRGIGQSTAVQCFDNAEQEGTLLGDLGNFPLTFAAQEQFTTAYTTFAETCAATQKDLLAHVSTADTARDLEQLRIADGDKPLNYWGISYGTFLGATYANLFPTKIRSLVLDGNLSPEAWTAGGASPVEQSVGQRIGSPQVEQVFDLFLQLCTTAGTAGCAFAEPTVTQTTQKWDALLERLTLGPVSLTSAGGEARTLDLPTLIGEVSDGLDIVWPVSGSTGWTGLGAALEGVQQAAAAQPPTPATGGNDAPSPTTEKVPYAGAEQPLSVTCGDTAVPSIDRLPTLAAEAQLQDGYFGLNVLYNDFPCSFWMFRAADPYSGPWNADLSASPLVVNTTHDPSTPIANAVEMAGLLDGARLLTVDGYGHTSLLNRSSCASDAVSAYLVDGTLPLDNTHCAQDAQPFQ